MPYIGKSPTGTGVRSRYYFTASGSETSLSGADDSGATLTFTDGAYVDVSLNGIALVAGTDYNTTTANTIGGLAALSASDVVEILVYDIFTVADTVSASAGGTFSGNVVFTGTVTGVDTITKVTSDPTATTNAALGDVYLNTSSGEMFVCTNATTNDNAWVNVGEGTGNINTSYSADFLVIAGGGGGGSHSGGGGGAGGAGGYRASYNSEASGGGGSSESS